MAKEFCPHCEAEHYWNGETDSYDTAALKKLISMNREVFLWVCSCGGVLAVTVDDQTGSTLFVPSAEK